jgi:DNA-binding LacI/PurR family transcriptional regulator
VLSDKYLVELARSIEEAVSTHGYDLHLRLGGKRRDGVVADSQPADGLVLVTAPETTSDDIAALSNDGKIPVVVVSGDQPLDYANASYVCIDTVPGVAEAIRKFASLGHTRIGYIGSGRPGSHVRAAFPDILAQAGLEFDPDLAVEAGITQDEASNAAIELLRKSNPPTAIFTRTDVLAAGAMQGIHSLGLSVPGDVSVIGHDNIEVAALVSPPLTTVSIDIPQIGHVATRMLLEMIDDKAEPRTETLGAHLVERQSAGPAPKK